METPLWKFDETTDGVYEPREDSFLLLDALEADLKLIKEKCCPTIALEVGSGSGIIISAISKQLDLSALCLAIDINPAACKITSETAILNNVTVEVLRSDLINGLKLEGTIDLFVFNPPYIPSSEDEMFGMLDKAWAGSSQGRSLIDRLFPELPRIMSERCVGYLVAIEENNPDEMIKIISSMGFDCLIVSLKKIIGEKLYIIRFSKGIIN
uniref:Methyltransferase HEMK2 n=1 Tax=Triatoma infestans TaxID=30076 RepID=A0A023F7J7_TRIIF